MNIFAPIMPAFIYWTVVVLLMILLSIRIFMGDVDSRHKKWVLGLNTLIAVLILRFGVHIGFRVIAIINNLIERGLLTS